MQRSKLILSLVVVSALSFSLGVSSSYFVLRQSKPEPAPQEPPAPDPPMPLAYAFSPSPYFDERPQGVLIDAVIVHATTINTLEASVEYFLHPNKESSTHFVVGRAGEIVQLVPIEKRAWHAGASLMDGKEHVNDFSVGIEMVNLNDGVDPYPEAQYEAVAGLIRFLRSRYQIPDERIQSHGYVAQPPGRKSDPLGFDLEKLRNLARSL